MTADPLIPDTTRGGDPTPLARTVRPLQAAAHSVTPAPPYEPGWTAEDQAEMQALQQRNRSAWYLRHRPAQYEHAALTDLDHDQDPKGVIAGWLDSDSRTLLLAGPVGTGKSHVGYAITNTAQQRGLLTVAVSVPDLLAELRPGGDSTVGARARLADLLLLDDIGTERGTDWTTEQLTSLLDARVRENRRQVVTTNAQYSELEARLGARTMSRLTGGATIVLLQGEDRRRRTW